MSFTLRTIAVLVCAASIGCVQSAWVHEKNTSSEAWCSTKRLKGIPFRTKATVLDQVTTYEKRWKKVTLQKKTLVRYTASGSEKVLELAEPARIFRTPGGSDELAELRREVVENGDESDIMTAFLALPALDVETLPQKLVGNELQRKQVVDPDRELYLNAPLPWFGTSNLAAKLASDGTLSEATTSAETKLAEGLSTLLPIKEVASAIASKAMTPPVAMLSANALTQQGIQGFAVPSRQPSTVVFELSIEDEGLLWSFTELAAEPTDDGEIPPLPYDIEKGNFTTRPLSAATQAKAGDGKRPEISISGQVKLPKEAGAKSD